MKSKEKVLICSLGVLPPAGAIVVRRTARSKETDVWIATFVWSIVYNGSAKLSHLHPLLFEEEEVKKRN